MNLIKLCNFCFKLSLISKLLIKWEFIFLTTDSVTHGMFKISTALLVMELWIMSIYIWNVKDTVFRGNELLSFLNESIWVCHTQDCTRHSLHKQNPHKRAHKSIAVKVFALLKSRSIKCLYFRDNILCSK